MLDKINRVIVDKAEWSICLELITEVIERNLDLKCQIYNIYKLVKVLFIARVCVKIDNIRWCRVREPITDH